MNKRLFATLAATVLLGVALMAPETVLAGTGGTEFTAAYTTVTGWMTGILGRLIAAGRRTSATANVPVTHTQPPFCSRDWCLAARIGGNPKP